MFKVSMVLIVAGVVDRGLSILDCTCLYDILVTCRMRGTTM